jgi:hypothetical protein
VAPVRTGRGHYQQIEVPLLYNIILFSIFYTHHLLLFAIIQIIVLFFSVSRLLFPIICSLHLYRMVLKLACVGVCSPPKRLLSTIFHFYFITIILLTMTPIIATITLLF